LLHLSIVLENVDDPYIVYRKYADERGAVVSFHTEAIAEVPAIIHIHTQAQAQVELERQRAQKRARTARQKEELVNPPPEEMHAAREGKVAANNANYTHRKEWILKDPEYRLEMLHNDKLRRDAKRKKIEDDPLYVNAGKDADKMAKMGRVARVVFQAFDARDREALIEKVRERYFSNLSLIDLMLDRIAELDAQFSNFWTFNSKNSGLNLVQTSPQCIRIILPKHISRT
jgi:hypothetical protein